MNSRVLHGLALAAGVAGLLSCSPDDDSGITVTPPPPPPTYTLTIGAGGGSNRRMQARDEVVRGQRAALTAEDLARDALHQVAHVGALGQLLRHDHAEARGIEPVRPIVQHVVLAAQGAPKSKNG